MSNRVKIGITGTGNIESVTNS